jgi:hypothetical protein
MEATELKAVSAKFEFAAWKGTNRLGRELLIRNIAFPKDLVAGFESARTREIDPGDGTRLLRVSWPLPGREGASLVMDVRECKTRDQAHEVLLELLANMQAPDVKRLGEDAPGDVAFARDSSGAMVFARGNVAISIGNGGRQVVSIADAARAIDRWLVGHGQ